MHTVQRAGATTDWPRIALYVIPTIVMIVYSAAVSVRVYLYRYAYDILLQMNAVMILYMFLFPRYTYTSPQCT